MPELARTEHKEMTEAEVKAFAAKAFDAERAIKAAYVDAHGAWWDLAEKLYEFHEAGYWAVLGYESLDAFLAQPDLGMSRASFFRASKTFRDLVVTKRLPLDDLKQLEPMKVQEVVPAIMRGEVKAEDALDDAAGLSYRDVKRKYRPEEQAKHGQKTDDTTRLAGESEPVPVQCFNCGQWYTPEPGVVQGNGTEVGDGDKG